MSIKAPVRQGDSATCGHTASGQSDITITGVGISLVSVDAAGGVITGPGAARVTCKTKKISLDGDGVAYHGIFPHSSPTMIASIPVSSFSVEST